jgi:tape measure domain-containing protein
MTDFRINVIIDPKGATQGGKAVERQLGRVETSANRVQTALKRAFAFLTVGFAIKEIVNFADSLTDLQNRLRLLVPEQQQLVKTTRDLLGVANQTRTAFEGTVILYQRLGLATRELGVDSGDLLGIVKSINQALILSGASAKEANNGLIQLSQGIAANRLGGDELRSTLEQLPAVADVIAKELGITRGQLRELGAEGKITGEIIIEAFRNAKDELEQNFAKTIPTLSQSFTVLRNNLTVFFGELNEGTGLLRGLGAAIRFVGNNVDALVRSLVVLGTTFGALRLAPTIQAFFELQAAAKAGRVVILGSAEAARQKAIFDRDQAAAALTAAGAEVQKAQATVASTEADVAASAAAVQRLATEQAKIDIQVLGAQANLQAAQAGLAQAEADRANIPLSGTLADVRARVAIADANVAASRRGVLVATDQAAAAEARLAAATSAVTDASAAAQATQARLAAAHEAAATAATAQTACHGCRQRTGQHLHSIACQGPSRCPGADGCDCSEPDRCPVRRPDGDHHVVVRVPRPHQAGRGLNRHPGRFRNSVRQPSVCCFHVPPPSHRRYVRPCSGCCAGLSGRPNA